MTTIVTLPADGVTKRDIIEQSFEDCGLAGYEFERTADEIASALRTLNTMMREWPWDRMGYTLPYRGQGDAAEGSGVPDKYVQSVVTALALRMAPGMGKALSPEQRAARTRSYQLMHAELALVPAAQFEAGAITGQGNRRWGLRTGTRSVL